MDGRGGRGGIRWKLGWEGWKRMKIGERVEKMVNLAMKVGMKNDNESVEMMGKMVGKVVRGVKKSEKTLTEWRIW